MGLFDIIKNTAIKAKCAAGFHAGEFMPIDEKPECNIEKYCPDCNKHIQGFRHEFSEEEYVNSYSCKMQKKCIYCDEVKERVVHGSFQEIDKDDYCRIKERCTRCNLERTGNTKHDWQKISSTPTETHIEYWCKKCGKSEMREKRKL